MIGSWTVEAVDRRFKSHISMFRLTAYSLLRKKKYIEEFNTIFLLISRVSNNDTISYKEEEINFF